MRKGGWELLAVMEQPGCHRDPIFIEFGCGELRSPSCQELPRAGKVSVGFPAPAPGTALVEMHWGVLFAALRTHLRTDSFTPALGWVFWKTSINIWDFHSLNLCFFGAHWEGGCFRRGLCVPDLCFWGKLWLFIFSCLFSCIPSKERLCDVVSFLPWLELCSHPHLTPKDFSRDPKNPPKIGPYPRKLET